jgi:hypothetical protein
MSHNKSDPLSNMPSPILVVLTVFILMIVLLMAIGRLRFKMLMSYVPFEGFMSPILEDVPDAVQQRLVGASIMDEQTEKLLVSERLVPMNADESMAGSSRYTAERCFRADLSEQLRKTGNYAQRSNNYVHSHPDVCSAPRHELIGSFYQPHQGIASSPLPI